MATGQLKTQPAVHVIAAGLTRQEWLADRRKPAIRFLRILPGCHWLIAQLTFLVQPRLVKAACRRVGNNDKSAVVRQLLAQGNWLGDLFLWTPSALRSERLDREIQAVDWLISTTHGFDNAEELTLQLITRLENNLAPESRKLLSGLKTSMIQAAQQRLAPLLTIEASTSHQCLSLAREAQDIHDCIQRLCQRLAQDKQLIHQTYGVDITLDQPTTLKLGCGDTHLDGESTTLIGLKSGKKLLYKPRDMALEQALSALLEPGAIPKILSKDGYGYQEHVIAGTPDAAMGTYLGRLIAGLDVLGTVDLHQENLIIGTNQAWLVDGETVLHRRYIQQQQQQNSTKLVLPPLGDSVLVLGVVAPPVETTFAGSSFWRLDHGLSRLSLQRDLLNDQTQRHVLVPLNTIEQNLLKAYAKQLEQDAKTGGLPWRQLKNLRGLRRRIVMRNTSIYGALLRQMRRHQNRRYSERTLEGLWELFHSNPKHPLLVDLATAEALELAKGHIPFFTTRIGSPRLDPINGIEIPANQHRSVLQEVHRRQRQRTSRRDQIWQVGLLHSALLLFRPPELNQNPVQSGDIIRSIEMIKEHLNQTALNWQGESLWLTMDRSASTRACFGLDRNLYGGSQGITLALQWLNSKRPVTQFRPKIWQRLEKLDGPAIAEINGDLLAWALHPQTPKPLPHPWLKALKKINHGLAQRLGKQSQTSDLPIPSCDLISGLAGLIGSVNLTLQNHKHQDKISLIQLQLRSVQLLLNLQSEDGSWPDDGNPRTSGLTGWSHGSAGVAAALGAVHNQAPKELATQIRCAIARAIEHELKWLNERGDWLDRRIANDQRTAVGQSWCHGAPGALLAAVVLHRYGLNNIDKMEQWIDFAIASTLRARPSVDGLCCGTSGLLLIQEIAAKEFDMPKLKSRATILRTLLAQKICNRQARFSDYFPLKHHPPGLFDGYSGVAIALHLSGTDHRIKSLLSYGLLT